MSQLILVVEDDAEIRELVKYNLERDGFRVAAVERGDQAMERVKAARPDALILDIMLPGRSGLELLQELRRGPLTRDLPVVLLTARASEVDKLVGFEFGADDYVTKPFSPRELVARLRAMLRRAQPASDAPATRVVNGLAIDFTMVTMTIAGAPLSLTRREFELLAFLAREPGRVMSREELLRKVWGYEFIGETRTVDVHVRRLRAKLGERSPLIETVTGIGYRFSDSRDSRPERSFPQR